MKSGPTSKLSIDAMVCYTGTLEPRPSGRAKLELEARWRLKEKPGPGMCVVFGCRKKHVDEKKGGKLHLCHRHFQERWRKRSPKQAAYATLRDHATGRKIPFGLSFARFVEITDAAGFWDQSAESRGEQLSIDRILAERGYEDDNVQVITVSENSKKSAKERFLSPRVQAILSNLRSLKSQAPWAIHGVTEGGELGINEVEEPF